MKDASIPATIAHLRATFEGRKTRSYEWRVEQLQRLKAMTVEKEEEIFAALAADLGKSPFESWLTETGADVAEIDHALAHLKEWVKPQKVSTPMSNQPGRSEIVYEPLGVVLIMGPWNYPFDVVVLPLIGAISAGNCAILKPSELTPRTSAVLARYVGEYLDQDAISVIEGGADVATELLDQRFDHIFFTGSERVGKVVMAAAAKHLTPVTLELGGKSPCIVHENADLWVAAKRVAWGKFINAGQTCVAPDYVLAQERIASELVEQLKTAIRDFLRRRSQVES